jgi:hypothetical protein
VLVKEEQLLSSTKIAIQVAMETDQEDVYQSQGGDYNMNSFLFSPFFFLTDQHPEHHFGGEISDRDRKKVMGYNVHSGGKRVSEGNQV